MNNAFFLYPKQMYFAPMGWLIHSLSWEEQRRRWRDLHLELSFNEGTYLTCDYKVIVVVILSLDRGSEFWYEWKANYISINIQGYLFGTELLKGTVYYAIENVEPKLRNLKNLYVCKYLLQKYQVYICRISFKEQPKLS